MIRFTLNPNTEIISHYYIIGTSSSYEQIHCVVTLLASPYSDDLSPVSVIDS